MMKFWPTVCYSPVAMEHSGIIFKGKGHSFPPSIFLFSSGWNVGVMAGSRAAILDCEVKVYVEDWRSIGPSNSGACA